MICVKKNIIIDQILDSYKQELGKNYESYRNHVYRVYNFALPYIQSENDIKILSIAVAFHDLGIWTSNTFDYIKPSIDLAKQYSIDTNLNSITTIEIENIISEHHKLSQVKTSKLAEIFRRADIVDLTLGIICKGHNADDIRMVKKVFPNKRFHFNLFKLFFRNLIKHPLHPLPMYKL